MMAMETDITTEGVVIKETKGTESEMAALERELSATIKLRDEVIAMESSRRRSMKSANPNL